MSLKLATGVAAVLLIVLHSPFALAQSTGRVNVEANELVLEGEGGNAIFRGDVVASRDGTTIKGQKLEVVYMQIKASDGTTKKEVDYIDVVDGVTIDTGKETITANSARIIDRQDNLIANGNVKVVQGGNVIRGQKLTVNLKTKKIDMSGGRVKGSFQP
jgi:lipopolysaccharide export system protein LptA